MHRNRCCPAYPFCLSFRLHHPGFVKKIHRCRLADIFPGRVPLPLQRTIQLPVMKTISLLLLLLLPMVYATAQEDAIRKKQFNLEKNGLAIQGYDPVAYQLQHKAVEGSATYSTVFKGVTYRFSSDANRKLFLASPEKYEPAYGGWCAYAMGQTGEKVEVDPETFKVINGKTYLFYNFYFTNTLKSWNANETSLKTKADKNWTGFISK